MKLKIVFFVFFFTCIPVFFLYFFKPNIYPSKEYATIVLDKNDEVLSSRTAADKQWRFKNNKDSISNKYLTCMVAYEDKRYFNHFGIDFFAIARAIYQNRKADKIISGGSTITMQLARLLRNRKGKSYINKCIEIFYSIWIEIAYSKTEILNAYTQLAPFGGNVVGIEAASWKFFGHQTSDLTWSEAALLAILPNNPARLFPGRNNKYLIIKRNVLLKKLLYEQKISLNDYQNALVENIPQKMVVFENNSPHLLDYLVANESNGIMKTNLDLFIQQKCNQILNKHQSLLGANGVHNACVLVLDVKKNTVLAYVGNMPNSKSQHHKDVDMIQAPRSTGSILKPLLFAMNLNDGKLLSNSLVADIPTIIAGYQPKNYDLTYDGAVPFKQAIHRSLNVPSVRVLQEYGIEQFHFNLKKLGITTLNKPASHYGLSIILGGAEATLWDISQVYAAMARSLNAFNIYNKYTKIDFNKANILFDNQSITYSNNDYVNESILNAGSVFQTFEAMSEVSRPEQEAGWKLLSNKNIAWKTGTSFGNRDAWAVGCTPEFIVGVLVGNATGEGRADLTGIRSAAPIMFDVFNVLGETTWFELPQNDLFLAKICKKSGFKSNSNCEQISEELITKNGSQSPICNYCKKIFLDKKSLLRVNLSCANFEDVTEKKIFSLPATMEHYYKSKHADYKIVPSYKIGCNTQMKTNFIEIIYPQNGTKIFIPKVIDNKKGKITFEAAYKGKGKLFWHLDNDFISETVDFHQISLIPNIGKHSLVIEDSEGNQKNVKFEILN